MSFAYKRRRNKNDKWDSICLRCFQTIRTAPEAACESDLSCRESQHVCNEADLPVRYAGIAKPGMRARHAVDEDGQILMSSVE